MDDSSDLDLIRRLSARDADERQAAFSELFARHHRRAYDLAYRVLGDTGLASDAVQESFLTIYRKGARFEARARFTSWLHRVVLNRCIDMQRRERRHRMVPLATGGAADDPDAAGAGVPEPSGDPRENPLTRSLGAERAELVRTAIRRLSPKLAEVVVLRYPQGRSYEEIGEILGVPPGTVKSRLNRAQSALRGSLSSELGEAGEEAES